MLPASQRLPRLLPHIFDRFYRIDTASSRSDDANNSQDGAGLGLAIAQWAAHAHGGDLRIHSEPGHGSVFELALPMERRYYNGL